MLVTNKEGYEPMITTILRLTKSKDYAILMKHKQFVEDVASGGWELSGVESVGN